MDWVTELLAKIDIGKPVAMAEFGPDITKFIKDNKALLIKVGKETFRGFLMLIHEKRNSEAFNLLLAKMDADDIIARLEQGAEALKQDNDLRDKFVAALKKWSIEILAPHAINVLVGLLV